ncbi:hypothetical protein [Chondrinema litorale]|uniref:hypothetical protein n=1 Tax=Chondrinema litorale TaxID=2994555 RepID=UPI002543EF1D|nr:hypothetical protein [Chondrinema litorale]UZR94394.1 hypothetical protein OQ292_01000 [Chondrinema litorale]
MKTFIKLLTVSFLFTGASSFAQVSQEWDDTYFFTTDRSTPASISDDVRIKPSVNFQENSTSKYANPDYNGDAIVENSSYNYYSEDQLDNIYDENYVFGSNYVNNPYGYYGNPYYGYNGAYSRFNDPFFSPYYSGYSNPWAYNRGFRRGLSMSLGFGSMYGMYNMGYGSPYYDPFYSPYYDPYYASYYGYGYYGGMGYYNRYSRRPTVVVIENNVRSVENRISRGNAAYSRYSDRTVNSNKISSYTPSSNASRAANSRIRNIEQIQERVNNRTNGRVSSYTNSNNSRSSYSSGRSSSSSFGTRNSSNYNSGRNSFNNNSYSSPSRRTTSSFSTGRSSSSSGASRSSAPVRRGRQ